MTAPEGSPAALPLMRSAELVGHYRWVEHRLFELTGTWAPAAAVPAARVHLDAVSLQHAWHAGLWEDRLPVLDGVDPEALVRPTPVLAALFAAIEPAADAAAAPAADAAGAEVLVDRLTGLYRVVLPRLLVGYGRHLARTAPVTDAPTARALRLVVRDELESWQAGEALLEGLLAAPQLVVRAAGVQARLESLLAADGPSPGLVPWPSDPVSAPAALP